jgi:hypothetical protein
MRSLPSNFRKFLLTKGFLLFEKLIKLIQVFRLFGDQGSNLLHSVLIIVWSCHLNNCIYHCSRDRLIYFDFFNSFRMLFLLNYSVLRYFSMRKRISFGIRNVLLRFKCLPYSYLTWNLRASC